MTGGRQSDGRSCLCRRCCSLLTEHGWQRSGLAGGLAERAPAEISVTTVDFLPGRSAPTFERSLRTRYGRARNSLARGGWRAWIEQRRVYKWHRAGVSMSAGHNPPCELSVRRRRSPSMQYGQHGRLCNNALGAAAMLRYERPLSGTGSYSDQSRRSWPHFTCDTWRNEPREDGVVRRFQGAQFASPETAGRTSLCLARNIRILHKDAARSRDVRWGLQCENLKR